MFSDDILTCAVHMTIFEAMCILVNLFGDPSEAEVEARSD